MSQSAIESDRLAPCPFCGSTDLLDGDWYLDSGEVDAIECGNCFCGAPANIWNQRVSDEKPIE